MRRSLVVNSHQSNASRRDSKFNSLLQDYLDLQKENVRKKRKIRSARRKIETLMHEVGFLKQRYEYLMNSQFSQVREDENDIGQEGKEDQEWTDTHNTK